MSGPGPAGERAVDNRHPNEGKDHRGEDAAAFCETAHEDADGDTCELHLVEAVEQLRDEGRAGRRGIEDVHEAEVSEVANEAIRGRAGEGEGVAPEEPVEDDDGVGSRDCPNEGESGLAPREAGVEER